LETAAAGRALAKTQSSSAAARTDLERAGCIFSVACRVRRKIYISLKVLMTVQAVGRLYSAHESKKQVLYHLEG
jgi:hypothetical protein